MQASYLWGMTGICAAVGIWGSLAFLVLFPHVKRQFVALTLRAKHAPFRLVLGVIAVGLAVAYAGTKPQPPEPVVTNTITYLNLEGAANTNATEFTVNDLPLVLAPLTREGWRFLGWTPQDGVIPAGTATNVTFTAKWCDESATDEQELSVSGQGWHEVSFAVLPESGDPADVFAPVEDKVGYVTYGSLNWNPLTGGTLMALEIGKGYWVQTTAANVSWPVTGQGNPGVEISLKPGWNLIGYPLFAEGEVETVLATALATGKIDWIYSGSRVYPGTLKTMAPGKGYWVYANAAVTIRFDAK